MAPARRERLLTWRSGGWVLCLGGILAVASVAWNVARFRAAREGHIGDGRTVASYRFDLSDALVPLRLLGASGQPKDGLPALVDPAVLTAAEVHALGGRQKLLVSSDLVLGIAWGGEARAYPLRILAWHAVANDVLGERPVAVTYDALCDASAVFDRRVGGETLVFGFSGLLLDGNLLLHDRRADGAESLWSQLQGRAVTGPMARAGRTLRGCPCAVLPWADWEAAHPETTVLAPDPQRTELYARSTYGLARARGHFPEGVEPYPPPGPLDPWEEVLAIRRDDGPVRLLAFSRIAARAGEAGVWKDGRDGLRIRHRTAPEAAWVEGADGSLAIVQAAWYAWFAAHPDGPAPEE